MMHKSEMEAVADRIQEADMMHREEKEAAMERAQEANTGQEKNPVYSDAGTQGGEEPAECSCHLKATPRSEEELRRLRNRLNRMIGQMNGIGRMLDENRYCGDILTQIGAVESALQSFGYMILRGHMETCVVEEILRGNTQVVDEAVELMKKLK